MLDGQIKEVRLIASSKRDLRKFPKAVQRDVGQALYAAQCGTEYPDVKSLSGFGGCSVLEIVTDFVGDTWRTVYTFQFADTIYVLHAFQKKSQKGIATPKQQLDLIHQN